MMRANTNQAKKQLKPTHVHSIKKEPHKKEIPLEQREGCEIRALSIRKKPSVIKVQECLRAQRIKFINENGH